MWAMFHRPWTKDETNGPWTHGTSSFLAGGECGEQQPQRDAVAGGGAVRARGDSKKIQRERETKNVKNDDNTTTVNCDLE